MKSLPAELQGLGCGRGRGAQEREQEGCSLLSSLQPTHSPRTAALRATVRLTSADPGCRSWVTSLVHQSLPPSDLRAGWAHPAMPGLELKPLLPDLRERQMASGLWPQSHGVHLDNEWSHCHTQGPIGSQAEPDVRGKRDINEQPQGLWGQKRAMTHKHCRCPGLRLRTVGSCRGLCRQKGLAGALGSLSTGHFEGISFVPKGVGIPLGGGPGVYS